MSIEVTAFICQADARALYSHTTQLTLPPVDGNNYN